MLRILDMAKRYLTKYMDAHKSNREVHRRKDKQFWKPIHNEFLTAGENSIYPKDGQGSLCKWLSFDSRLIAQQLDPTLQKGIYHSTHFATANFCKWPV